MAASTRLGLSTFALGWSIGVPGYPAPQQPLNALDIIDRAHELGLSLVQFGDNLPLHALSDEELNALRQHAHERHIAFELGMRGLQAPAVERYLDLAQMFDARLLRVVVDTSDDQPTPPQIIERIRQHLPRLERDGVTLAIENHDRLPVETLAAIMREINHPHVGICLDTVNSFGSLEGPQVVIEALGRYTVCLHVKEFVVKRADHNMGFLITGAPSGQGMLDIPWVMRSLAQHGRSFNAIIECWLAPTNDMEQTIATEQAWLRESVQYLRTLITE